MAQFRVELYAVGAGEGADCGVVQRRVGDASGSTGETSARACEVLMSYPPAVLPSTTAFTNVCSTAFTTDYFHCLYWRRIPMLAVQLIIA